MSWTKRNFIETAYAGIGLSKDNYTISPSDFEKALSFGDGMVSSWQGKFGYGVGWPVHDDPDDSSVDEETYVSLTLSECVWSNLALRIAASIGKQVLPDTKTLASSSYKTMSAKFSKPRGKSLPQGVPLGGGNRWRGSGKIFSGVPAQESQMVDNEIEGL
jgi:hypothetical protein